MNFEKFSPTMFATYKKCPRMFKYQYVDKLGEKFRQPRPFLSMGNSVHNALAKFMGYDMEKRTLELLQSILRAEWISEGFLNREQEEEFYHRAVDMLNHFYRSGEWKNPADFIEQWFEVEVGDFSLIGRIDRIDGASVIDYKTGNYIPKPEELKDDFQTVIYTFAGKHITGRPVDSITFHYLGPEKKVEVKKTDEELKKNMEEIKKLVREIRSDEEFFPTPHRIWCLYCDFNCICPLAGVQTSTKDKDKLAGMMMKGTEEAYYTLYEILGVSTSLGGILDFEILTKQIIEVFKNFSECSKLLLFLKSQRGDFYLRGAWGVDKREIDGVRKIVEKSDAFLNRRMPSIIRKPENEANLADFFSALDLAANFSAIFIPFIAREKQFGSVIMIRNSQPYSQRELIVLNTLSNIAQIALDNSIHYTQAIIDDLTGLYVRKYFERRLSHELERFRRFSTPFALCMFDLDHFKKVNDTYGHPFGDKILIQFASILKKQLRTVDIVARFGGEEFIALLPETDLSASTAVAERIRAAIEKNVYGDNKTKVAVTTSIGVLPVPPPVKSVLDGIEKVDEALYEAKESGRNCVKVYGKKQG
ncbi:MAG: diguanylate cyclase [Elusimicrobia bacterium]|nr:diguanylate cyclase [Elusimicrobiota bacterium]